MGHLGGTMKKTWLSDNAHIFLKEKAKNDKKSIIETVDFLIEVFKQVTTKITFEQPKQGTYNTYRKAFYEQNKHLLELHERQFFERNKKRMKIYYEKNKEKLQIFKVAFMQQCRKDKKARLKKYNQEYYQRCKNV